MAIKKRNEGPRTGFSKNPLLLLLDILDTPANVIRGTVAAAAEDENILDSALRNLTRQEVTTGVDVNRALGLTSGETAPLVEGAAGLATGVGLGAITAPTEAAVIGKGIRGITGAKDVTTGVRTGGIIPGIKESLGLKQISDIPRLPTTPSRAQRVGRKIGQGARGVLAKEQVDPLTGRKVLEETTLNQLKENQRFSRIFRPVKKQARQQRSDIGHIVQDVEKRQQTLATSIENLNLDPNKKDLFNLTLAQGMEDEIKVSPGLLMDKVLDALPLGRGKKQAPNFSALTRPDFYKSGVVIPVKHMEDENVLTDMIRQINVPLKETTGIDDFLSVSINAEKGTAAIRPNSRQIETMLRDVNRLKEPNILNNIVNSITRQKTPTKQNARFLNLLNKFSASTKTLNVDSGADVNTVLQSLEQFNLKDIRNMISTRDFTELGRMQKAVRRGIKKPVGPVAQQMDQLSAVINADPQLFERFNQGVLMGAGSGQALRGFQALKGELFKDPDLLRQKNAIDNIFKDAGQLLKDTNKASAQASKFLGTGKFAEQQARGFTETRSIPQRGDFLTTQIDELSARHNIDPNIIRKALPKNGRFSTNIKQIADNLFAEGLTPQQTLALKNDIVNNEELFKGFTGDRGAGKQVMEGLVDSFSRIKEENKVRALKGEPLVTLPDIDINNILQGQLRGLKTNGPEEALFIDLVKSKGFPFKNQQVFKDGSWKSLQESGLDVTEFTPLNIESLPLQNNKSSLWRTKLLQDLGLDPTVAGEKSVLLPREVHEIVRDIGNGAHINNTLGLNPIRDRQLLKRMSERSQGQTKGVINALGDVTGKVMNMVRKVVIATPGYHARNQIGQVQNMYLSGLSPSEIQKYYPRSLSMWTKLWKGGKKDNSALREIIKNPRVKTYMQHFDRSPITFEQNFNVDPETVLKVLQGRMMREVGEGASTARFGVGKQGFRKNLNNILIDNLDLTIATDHASRFAVFERTLDKLEPLIRAGKLTPDAANKKAIEEAATIIFSRLDLGPDANDLLRNMFLFSGWTINNTKKVLREISSDPATLKRYLGVLKVTRGLQQNLGGEEVLSERALARGRFTLPVAGRDIEPKVFDSTALQGLGNVVDPFSNFTQSLSPALKLPIELGTGRDLFTGQAIKSAPRQILTSGLGMRNPLALLDLLVANTPTSNLVQAGATPDIIKNFFAPAEGKQIRSLEDIINAVPGGLFTIK